MRKEMSGFSKEIADAICKLDKSLEEIEAQKVLLENLKEVDVVNEEVWHEICETPLRYSKALIPLVQNMFPDAADIQVGCNDVCFQLFGMNIQIPTSRAHGINVDTSWYHKKLHQEISFELYERDKLTERYFQLLDSGHASWYDLACCCIRNATSYRRWYLHFLWITKEKYQKPNRNDWEKRLATLQQQHQARIVKRTEAISKQQEQVATLFEQVLPQIDRFSTVHYAYHGQEYSSCKIEEIAKLENIEYPKQSKVQKL